MDPVESEYQDIDESCLDMDAAPYDSSWSEAIEETSFNSVDSIHYYIQPVNEYENSEWKVYENYLQSDGYEEAVYNPERHSVSSNSDSNQDINESKDVNTEGMITYDIFPSSPVELTLFVHS